MFCRDATVDDGIAIARIWVAAWQAAYAGLMPADYLAGLDAGAALPAFEHSLKAGLSVLLLKMEGTAVGFSAYGGSRDPDATPETGEVVAINVHPAWWRRGLGRELLRETQLRLGKRGCSEATLWVLEGNTSAQHFYEALGWRPDGAEKQDDRLTGFALHEIRYRIDFRCQE